MDIGESLYLTRTSKDWLSLKVVGGGGGWGPGGGGGIEGGTVWEKFPSCKNVPVLRCDLGSKSSLSVELKTEALGLLMNLPKRKREEKTEIGNRVY